MTEIKPKSQYKVAVRTVKAKLPDEFLDILRTTRDKFSSASWEVARMLDDMETELGKALPRGQCADALGILPSEVSALILTARRIPAKLRNEYDGLPFSVFKYAARDESPADVLCLCAESADDYGGQPGTVRVMRAIIKARKGSGKKDVLRTWSGHIVYMGADSPEDGRCHVVLDFTIDNKPLDGAAVTVREV